MNIPPQSPGKGAAPGHRQSRDDQSVKPQRRKGRDDLLVAADLNAQQKQKSPDQNSHHFRRPTAVSLPEKPSDGDAAQHKQNYRKHIPERSCPILGVPKAENFKPPNYSSREFTSKIRSRQKSPHSGESPNLPRGA